MIPKQDIGDASQSFRIASEHVLVPQSNMGNCVSYYENIDKNLLKFAYIVNFLSKIVSLFLIN